jgi:uncharacterized membrane protein
MAYTKLHSSIDLSGAAISSICLIHCLGTPLFFLIKPILGFSDQSHQHGHSHGLGLDVFFLVLSLVAVWYSASHTSQRYIRYLLWLFWMVFALGLILEMTGWATEKYLMYFGSLALVATHLTSYRHCKVVEKRSKEGEQEI